MADQAPYLQRNPGPSPVDVPAIPATVQPGDTVLWPYPIAGFEPAPDPAPAPAPDVPAPDVPAKSTTKRAAASADTKEGQR